MSFTPGPWRVDISTDNFGWENYVINKGAKHFADEQAANARLIAAAPDLLVALQYARSLIGVEYTDAEIAPINAALAKAEGRE